MNRQEITRLLADRGQQLLASPRQLIEFTGNNQADVLLNDIEKHPHAFVLGCIMDRQIRSERAWLIPYEISSEIGSFSMQRLLALNLERTRGIFTSRRLHRFNDTMAENLFLAIRRIHEEYSDDASNMWRDVPKSATVVRRFLQFQGVGVKIASMAANILTREFKILFSDRFCVDVSPDVQVKRVFFRLGLIDSTASNDELIYCARELNPEYPGVFDLATWEIGKKWCRPRNPNCKQCYLDSFCPKFDVLSPHLSKVQ